MIFSEHLSHSDTYEGDSYSSENNLWEIALVPRLFGVAVQLNKVGGPCCCVTYCCGTDLLSLGLVVQGIKAVTKPISENLSVGEVERLFPPQYTKPLTADPELYKFFEEAACKA